MVNTSNFIKQILNPQEKVIYKAGFTKWSKNSSLVLLIFGGIFLIPLPPFGALCLLIGGYDLLRMKNTEIIITNQRLIVKTGIIARQTKECLLSKIVNLSMLSIW